MTRQEEVDRCAPFCRGIKTENPIRPEPPVIPYEQQKLWILRVISALRSEVAYEASEVVYKSVIAHLKIIVGFLSEPIMK